MTGENADTKLCFVLHVDCFVGFKVKSQPRRTSYNHPVIKRSTGCYSTRVLTHFCRENVSACDLTVCLYYKNLSVQLLWTLIDRPCPIYVICWRISGQ